VLLAPVLLGWVPCCGSAAAPDATPRSERPAGSADARDVVALIDEQLRRGWRESHSSQRFGAGGLSGVRRRDSVDRRGGLGAGKQWPMFPPVEMAFV